MRLSRSGVAKRKLGASFDLMDGAACGEKPYAQSQARISAPLGTLLIARSQVIPACSVGKTWHGRAGEAFALAESGVVARATANSSLPTTTGHKQVDQAARDEAPHRKPLADSGSEPGASASPLFKEPAARMTQHDGWFARGWAGRSPALMPKPTRFASNTRSER
jgi:hypothetical protein